MDDSIKGIAALSLSLYVNIGEDKNTYFYSGGVFFISLQNEGGDEMHVNKCTHECNPFDVDFSNGDYCEMQCRYSQCWRKYILYLNYILGLGCDEGRPGAVVALVCDRRFTRACW